MQFIAVIGEEVEKNFTVCEVEAPSLKEAMDSLLKRFSNFSLLAIKEGPISTTVISNKESKGYGR